MRVFTLDELQTIMRQAAGEWADSTAGGDINDTTYGDLGYDSLALLEVSARIEQTLGLQVPEESLTPSSTPRQTASAANLLLGAVVGAA